MICPICGKKFDRFLVCQKCGESYCPFCGKTYVPKPVVASKPIGHSACKVAKMGVSP